jgi:hypothetical protein
VRVAQDGSEVGGRGADEREADVLGNGGRDGRVPEARLTQPPLRGWFVIAALSQDVASRRAASVLG